jgi:hypothetical protein
LVVRVTDNARNAPDLAARRRLNFESGSCDFWKFSFLHLTDECVENSAVWRDYATGNAAGDSDAQRASRQALQQLHSAPTKGHSASHLEDQRELTAEAFKHTLMATAAASWTVADVALVPVAMLLGLIPAEAMDNDVQLRLGPVPPFALRSRASALDLSCWTMRIGSSLEQRDIAVDLPRMSLSAMARHVRTLVQPVAPAAQPLATCRSTFTVCLTEDQLRNFERAATRAEGWYACSHLYDALAPPSTERGKDPRETFREALKVAYDSGSAAVTPSDRHWHNKACIASSAKIDACDAAHLVPRSVGKEAYEAAETAIQRTESTVPCADTDLDTLALLDVRLGSLLPPAAETAKSIPLDSSRNGVFLNLLLHRAYDDFAFLFTPSLNFVHVTRPTHGALCQSVVADSVGEHERPLEQPGWHTSVLRDVTGTGEPNALKSKVAALHLSSFVSMCALFLVAEIKMKGGRQAAPIQVSAAQPCGSTQQAGGSAQTAGAQETATHETGEASEPSPKRPRTNVTDSDVQVRSAGRISTASRSSDLGSDPVSESSNPTSTSSGSGPSGSGSGSKLGMAAVSTKSSPHSDLGHFPNTSSARAKIEQPPVLRSRASGDTECSDDEEEEERRAAEEAEEEERRAAEEAEEVERRSSEKTELACFLAVALFAAHRLEAAEARA